MSILTPVYYGSSKSSKNDPLKSSLQSSLSDSEIHIHDQTSSKALAQVMYKQNMELAVVNKTLSVLQKLYAITLSTLDVQEVAQRVVDALVTELNFKAALISLVDLEGRVLRPAAITKSPEIIGALSYLGKSLEELSIGLDYEQNLAINVVKDKERKITGNLLDILTPHLIQSEADEIGRITKIKTLILYPILLGDKCLGVLHVALAKKVDDLSRVEKESLEQLIGVVSISLERAQLHENLKNANAKLLELDHLKDEFVSLASHELRTPMTAIKGSLSTILEGYAGEISKESREFLAAAYNENDRLIRLVNNLLNISRIEGGRFTFSVAKTDINKLIEEVVHNLQMSAKEKNLILKYEKKTLLPLVLADQDKVREVLINLIGNAIKFTHKGGVTVSANINKDKVVVSVADTGSGIAREDQDLLFKKFSQVQGSYAKTTGGTGLGLYISKQIIEGLKGTIWLESNLGKGSTFFFSLPGVMQ